MAAIALQAAHRQPRQPPVAEVKPLDPDVISAAIPAFFIGRNTADFWVAREARGRIGGLFLFKRSAVDFANRQSAPARTGVSHRDLRARPREPRQSADQSGSAGQEARGTPRREVVGMIELKIAILVALMGALLLGVRLTAAPTSDS